MASHGAGVGTQRIGYGTSMVLRVPQRDDFRAVRFLADLFAEHRWRNRPCLGCPSPGAGRCGQGRPTLRNVSDPGAGRAGRCRRRGPLDTDELGRPIRLDGCQVVRIFITEKSWFAEVDPRWSSRENFCHCACHRKSSPAGRPRGQVGKRGWLKSLSDLRQSLVGLLVDKSLQRAWRSA